MSKLPHFTTITDLGTFAGDLRSLVFSSHQHIATELKLNRTTILRYENGKTHPPISYMAFLAQQVWVRHLQPKGNPTTDQLALLHEINKAIRANYHHDVPYHNWDELEADATKYLSERIQTKPGSIIPSDNETPIAIKEHSEDWGDAPAAVAFLGREKEVTQLESWIYEGNCRLIGIFAMGGMGKTDLAARVARMVATHFRFVFWRSLRNAPTVAIFLEEALHFLSGKADVAIPTGTEQRLRMLLQYLRREKCLFILDNVETILQLPDQLTLYREGYEEYSHIIRAWGETEHQSCLILTSRQKLTEFTPLEGNHRPIRSLRLYGLTLAEAPLLLQDKGLHGTDDDWQKLILHYSGNPLALSLVAETIKELYDGNVAYFLQEGSLIFGDIRDLLSRQFDQLPSLWLEILYWLAIAREAISLEELRRLMVQPITQAHLQETMMALRRRFLVEMTAQDAFTLQNIIMEYLTGQFITQICGEVLGNKPSLFHRYALILAQAREYIQESQAQMIMQPVVHYLLERFGQSENLINHLRQMVVSLQAEGQKIAGYATGNILDMLIYLHCDLRGWDFSHLAIWGSNLRHTELPSVNLSYTHIRQTVFTEALDTITALAFAPHGDFLAIGTPAGNISIWNMRTNQRYRLPRAHEGRVYSLAFSPDGSLLVSSGDDCAINLINIDTKIISVRLKKHDDWVVTVAFHPEGTQFVSGSYDGVIHLWELASLTQSQSFVDLGAMHCVTFSPDGRFIATGHRDGRVCLRELSTGIIREMMGHGGAVWQIVFSPTDSLVASASDDHTIRLWDIHSGESRILRGHTRSVRWLDFSQDGQVLASSSDDQTVRLWQIETGTFLRQIRTRPRLGGPVAFNGETLATSSEMGAILLWNQKTGQQTRIWQGYTNRIEALAFSPDGSMLVSSGTDLKLRIWDVDNGRSQVIFTEHGSWTGCLAFHPGGTHLATGSYDHTVRLWELYSGQCVQIIPLAKNWIWAVTFSPDGLWLASAGYEPLIHLYEISTGQIKTWATRGHWVWQIAFSYDGQWLVAGGEDRSISLWNVTDDTCHQQFWGHQKRVRTVAFSPDGSLVASGSDDQTVRLWNVQSGQCEHIWSLPGNHIRHVVFSADGKTIAAAGTHHTIHLLSITNEAEAVALPGHQDQIKALAFHPNNLWLASGSEDETIRLWDAGMGVCWKILQCERPYEGLNITGATGLTDTQKSSLKTLGAIES